jgi:hypothetical protein
VCSVIQKVRRVDGTRAECAAYDDDGYRAHLIHASGYHGDVMEEKRWKVIRVVSTRYGGACVLREYRPFKTLLG